MRLSPSSLSISHFRLTPRVVTWTITVVTVLVIGVIGLVARLIFTAPPDQPAAQATTDEINGRPEALDPLIQQLTGRAKTLTPISRNPFGSTVDTTTP